MFQNAILNFIPSHLTFLRRYLKYLPTANLIDLSQIIFIFTGCFHRPFIHNKDGRTFTWINGIKVLYETLKSEA